LLYIVKKLFIIQKISFVKSSLPKIKKNSIILFLKYFFIVYFNNLNNITPAAGRLGQLYLKALATSI